MRKMVIHTDKVPPARIPLSQGIRAGDWIFASGQLGNDPRTGKLAEGGIRAQTRQVCENLKAVLESAGSSLDTVTKVTIYMVDFSLGGDPPAAGRAARAGGAGADRPGAVRRRRVVSCPRRPRRPSQPPGKVP